MQPLLINYSLPPSQPGCTGYLLEVNKPSPSEPRCICNLYVKAWPHYWWNCLDCLLCVLYCQCLDLYFIWHKWPDGYLSLCLLAPPWALWCRHRIASASPWQPSSAWWHHLLTITAPLSVAVSVTTAPWLASTLVSCCMNPQKWSDTWPDIQCIHHDLQSGELQVLTVFLVLIWSNPIIT